jgi:tetratricopeptide (TPR) repeat protein
MRKRLRTQRNAGVRSAMVAGVVITTMHLGTGALAGIAEDCASQDPNQSIRGCSLIIETGPTPQVDVAMAYSNRGRSHFLLGQFDKAVADLDESLRRQPAYAAAYGHRGTVHLAQGRNDLALMDYTRAIELDPSKAGYYYNRGNLYLGLKRIELGISDLSAAIKLQPDHAGAYCNRGLGFILAGERDKGIADLRRALQINPAHEIARRNLQALGVE